MALATQCPHCHTTFRVAHDQLKLRAGLVRCGACKQIFNGIENLLRPEEFQTPGKPQGPSVASAATAPVPPAASSSFAQASPAFAAPSGKQDAHHSLDQADAGSESSGSTNGSTSNPAAAMPEQSATPATSDTIPSGDVAHEAPSASMPPRSDDHSPQAAGDGESPPDPLLRMTLMDIAHLPLRPSRDEPAPAADAQHDPVERAIDDLQSKPWRSKPADSDDADALDQADASDYEEPGFVREARRKQRMTRGLNVFMVLASALLLGILLAQAAYVFRDQIAAYIPQIRPLLAAACARSGCQVGLPAEVDSVSIESSELQALAPDSDSFGLTVLLRNRGNTAQAWPSIELTLNDSSEKPLLRRVFAPRDYLPAGQDLNQGFPAKSEQAFKLHFRLSQLKAAGYRVYVFYP
ncbi:DUF3426 domain-containing protein [Noviherbaspirillum aerium]|uniref:DUF3426 domain-containing protein n=1 Tax=Noviherbaspirillum aerium TaxID=2588497 RepID=UPI00124E6FC3|nr:DUF3426 domain-containing protein [Noviherbaspirillum aerium]